MNVLDPSKHKKISIHTPHAGSDAKLKRLQQSTLYFNPHSPCGERPEEAFAKMENTTISIHTPHAGSDFYSSFLSPAAIISIHTPHAGSDLPVLLVVLPGQISIHTPHAGSDPGFIAAFLNRVDFNPHSPCGERPDTTDHCQHTLTNFNPHSPCGERPTHDRHIKADLLISIHTPHAGSDIFKHIFHKPQRYFNPHSPCGERPGQSFIPLFRIQFQSTLPMRGATAAQNQSVIVPQDFNPHSPCGERQDRAAGILSQSHFNPHSPCGERPKTPVPYFKFAIFQSTLPMRGATGTAICTSLSA